MRSLVLLVVCIGCGSSQSHPEGSDDAASDGAGEAPADIPVTPEKPAPPGLTDSEKKELAATCAPIEPLLYDAGKQVIATLDAELAKGAADAEQKALAAGVAMLKPPQEGLGAADLARCTALFEKQQKLRAFEHEPAEVAARAAVDSCVERVSASFGKHAMDFDMGGSGQEGASQGPFCPDDFPIPQSLKQLPYKSNAEDWNNNTWRCLQFGLRGEQPFQIEYSAPVGEGHFACIARFLPRQGGAPVEIVQDGKVNDNGELLIAKKIQKRRMK